MSPEYRRDGSIVWSERTCLCAQHCWWQGPEFPETCGRRTVALAYFNSGWGDASFSLCEQHLAQQRAPIPHAGGGCRSVTGWLRDLPDGWQ